MSYKPEFFFYHRIPTSLEGSAFGDKNLQLLKHKFNHITHGEVQNQTQ